MSSRLKLMIGRTISHYKILEKLGEGGMGVVYKAEDTKLKRIVALKFLPSELTREPEAKERFVHEAQAASVLEHSNICTVYEIDETQDGQMFIAMAYCKGETIKQKIEKRPFKIEQAIDIAMQVALGLIKAHNLGIVHRDIKSANILITEEDQAKIVDFGLAKLAGGTKLTKTGTTMGTTAYISPEQAKGEEVDKSTDIWSLGVVLYEMVTGQLPFKGEYEPGILYSIINEEPEPITGLRTGIPLELERIVQKALEKKKEERYQNVEDMLIDLRRVKRDTSEVPSQKPLSPKWKNGYTKLLGAMVIIVAILFLWPYLGERKPGKRVQTTHRQITFTGKLNYPSISPDGKFVAYVSKISPAEDKVFIQDLTGGQPLEIFKEKWIFDLRWSPDGSILLLSAGNDSARGSYILPRLGGTSQRFEYYHFKSWSPEASHFAGGLPSKKHIWFTNKLTGDTDSISLQGPFIFLIDIDWSPTGKFLLFLTEAQNQSKIWITTSDGTNQYKIVEDSIPLFSPRFSSKDDAIYYLRSHGQTKDLMKIKIDPASGKVKGSAIVIQSGLEAGDFFSISRDDKRLLYTREQSYSNLWLASYVDKDVRKDVKIKQLTTGTSSVFASSISPDGGKVAFSMGNPSKANIFVMPLEGGQIQQLTFFDSYNDCPVWSPDGKEIAFGSRQSGIPKIWRVNSSGGNPRPFQKTMLSHDFFYLVWSPGNDILYQRIGDRNFNLLNPSTEEETALVKNDTVGWMFNARSSPGGKKVAVYWDRKQPKSHGIWVISAEDTSQLYLYPGYIFPIAWSLDGNWIYGSQISNMFSPEIWMIPSKGGKAKKFVALPFNDIRGISIYPNGSKIACIVHETQSDAWLMENFDPEVK